MATLSTPSRHYSDLRPFSREGENPVITPPTFLHQQATWIPAFAGITRGGPEARYPVRPELVEGSVEEGRLRCGGWFDGLTVSGVGAWVRGLVAGVRLREEHVAGLSFLNVLLDVSGEQEPF